MFPNFTLFVVWTHNLVILEVQDPQLQERLLQAVYPVVAQIEDLQVRGQATGKLPQLFFCLFVFWNV